MSSNGERYTELMGPAFVSALENPEALAAVGDDFWLRYMAAQQAIKQEVGLVDWESTGLPDKVFGPDGSYTEKPLPPRGYAERLMVFAFDDALLPIQFSEKLVVEQGISLPLGQLLRDSKTNLLKVSRMVDRDKGHLYSVIKHRTTPELKDIADAFGPPEFEGSPIRLVDDGKGGTALDWQPQIRDWIEARLYPDRGCPANRYPVKIDGQNMSLTNFFWDRLTQILYL